MQGSSTDDFPRETALMYLRDALEDLGEYSTSLGTFFIYEPLNRYETNLFNHFGQACDFARNLKPKGLGYWLTFFTWTLKRLTLLQALAISDMLGHVHFADSNRKPIGYGHTDMHQYPNAWRK